MSYIYNYSVNVMHSLSVQSLRRFRQIPLRLQHRRAFLNLTHNILNHIVIIGLAGFLPRRIHHAIASGAARKAYIGEHGFAGAVDDAAYDRQAYRLGHMGEAVF